jgi:hypothetical protein
MFGIAVIVHSLAVGSYFIPVTRREFLETPHVRLELKKFLAIHAG